MGTDRNTPIPLPYDREGRPQIILIGNGLERTDDSCGTAANAGKSWDDMVRALEDPDCIAHEAGDLESVPFPLKYHLLSSPQSAPYPLRAKDRRKEQQDLAVAAQGMGTVTNEALRRLKKSGVNLESIPLNQNK